ARGWVSGSWRPRPGRDARGRGGAVAVTGPQIVINLLGAVNTIAPLVPAMCGRGRGRIAVIASVAAFRGLPYSPGYCASKAGLRAYGEALRPRLARHGIGVTVGCPGLFPYAMTDRRARPCHFVERRAR